MGCGGGPSFREREIVNPAMVATITSASRISNIRFTSAGPPPFFQARRIGAPLGRADSPGRVTVGSCGQGRDPLAASHLTLDDVYGFMYYRLLQPARQLFRQKLIPT